MSLRAEPVDEDVNPSHLAEADPLQDGQGHPPGLRDERRGAARGRVLPAGPHEGPVRAAAPRVGEDNKRIQQELDNA